MSRVAKKPVEIPKGVEVTLQGNLVKIKGPKGVLERDCHPLVSVVNDGDALVCSIVKQTPNAVAQAGTTRALLANMVAGVTKGFEKKLELRGVGYRAQAQGSNLNLTLGFSHPVSFPVPKGITVETPSQTEVVVKGIDKQQVGQVAAVIRGFRPPEPYKGKGVRYANEQVVIREAKKK